MRCSIAPELEVRLASPVVRGRVSPTRHVRCMLEPSWSGLKFTLFTCSCVSEIGHTKCLVPLPR